MVGVGPGGWWVGGGGWLSHPETTAEPSRKKETAPFLPRTQPTKSHGFWVYSSLPKFLSSLQSLSLPNCEGLARYSSSLQIPNCSSLSIPNQPIFAGEIPGNLFVFIQPSLWERLEFTHEIGNGECGGVT